MKYQHNSRFNLILTLLSIVLLLSQTTNAAFGESVNRTYALTELSSDSTTMFHAKQLIVPGTLFTLGTLGVGENSPLRSVNVAIKEKLSKLSNGVPLHFDDYLQYAPGVAYLAMSIAPRKGYHSTKERVAEAVMAYLSMAVIVNTLKYTVREMRPDGSRRNSFPSGHTATAFTGAELVRAEYGWPMGALAYTAATTVAFMRLYNNRHWANDVLSGAAVGILSAQIGRWLLPISRRVLNIKTDKNIAIAPLYSPNHHSIGLSYAMSF